MNWSESIKAAIDYIEDNLTNDITINDISKKCYTSPYLFEGMIISILGYMIFIPIIYSDIFKKRTK